MLTLAIPKGRTFVEAAALLASSGLAPAGSGLDDRRIVLPSQDAGVRLIVVRAADVQTYVSYGAAQLGLVGLDMLYENPRTGVYIDRDLGLARCRLVVAVREGFDYAQEVRKGGRLKVATKYPRLARRHFAEQGVHAEIVRLYGSMELAPLVGMSDVIVDLVQTGATLRANRLVEAEKIMDASTHLIINQSAFLRRRQAILAIVERLGSATANG